MIIQCDICYTPLEHPGALIFSPPLNGEFNVKKIHVCTTCWDNKIVPILNIKGETVQ